MKQLLDYPILLALVLFAILWLGTRVARWCLARRTTSPDADGQKDFGVILAAVLTLLGLIIGFTFSMAISRYDQRKNLEEAEANAIGTEYVRADLLPSASAAVVRSLLREYTDVRIRYYDRHSRDELREIAARRAQLQQELWAAVVPVALAEPTAVHSLVAAGMNDVLNSQGYTQAAWLNRIPEEAWILLLLVALLSNVLLVFSARSLRRREPLLLILPLVVSVSALLLADIDSPRAGIITVSAQNLHILAESLR
ncbi:MAG TPA: hypothetical protein VGI91_00990 [Steroidobacteraceae bacterium]|jgi:hypothetical protein